MIKIIIVFVISLTLLASCSKNDSLARNGIVGTWVFTSQVSNSFAYPSVITNPFPIQSSGWSVSFDSIKITFDANGNYVFSNFRWPVDKGTYIIKQDSILIINPDTVNFIKFNYTLPSVAFSSGPGPVQYSSYKDFHFSRDTIIVKKITGNNLSFSTHWLTKAQSPIIPNNDTLILNYSVNNFRRQ